MNKTPHDKPFSIAQQVEELRVTLAARRKRIEELQAKGEPATEARRRYATMMSAYQTLFWLRNFAVGLPVDQGAGVALELLQDLEELGNGLFGSNWERIADKLPERYGYPFQTPLERMTQAEIRDCIERLTSEKQKREVSS